MEWHENQRRQGTSPESWGEPALRKLGLDFRLSLMVFSVFMRGVPWLCRHMGLILTDSINQPYPVHLLENFIS